MKIKIITTILMGLLLIAAIIPASAQAQDLTLKINGEVASFPSSYGKVYLDNSNRMMVPVRVLSEKLGAEVKYDSASNSAVITYLNTKVTFPIGKDFYLKESNGSKSKEIMDTKAVALNGRLHIPVRYFKEAFTLGLDTRNYPEVNLTVSEHQVEQSKTKTNIAIKVSEHYIIKIVDFDKQKADVQNTLEAIYPNTSGLHMAVIENYFDGLVEEGYIYENYQAPTMIRKLETYIEVTFSDTLAIDDFGNMSFK